MPAVCSQKDSSWVCWKKGSCGTTHTTLPFDALFKSVCMVMRKIVMHNHREWERERRESPDKPSRRIGIRPLLMDLPRSSSQAAFT